MAKTKQTSESSPDITRMVDKAVDGGDDTELRAYLARLEQQQEATQDDEDWEEPEAAG